MWQLHFLECYCAVGEAKNRDKDIRIVEFRVGMVTVVRREVFAKYELNSSL
jgi:hypothetical protein